MSKRILVVEDQEDNRRILRDLLTSVGFQVSGSRGWRAGRRRGRDAPARPYPHGHSDAGRGRLRGHRQIKANPALKTIPVIVVTSYALSGDEDKARAAGCDDYITKPYSPRQLLGEDQRASALASAIEPFDA